MESFISILPPVTKQTIFIYATLGGFLPAFLWLLFWLREDSINPEPNRVLIGSFMFGALSAIFAVPFQGLFQALFPAAAITVSIIVFASVEEIAKYISVKISALKDIANDEALDPIIYMITAALGFAAIENTLYLINFMNNFDLVTSFLQGGKRFIGSTLLHTISSLVVGIALALSYRNKITRPPFLLIGLALAITIHSYFNIFVTHNQSKFTLYAFLGIWLLFAIMLVVLEYLKKKFRAKRLAEQKELGDFGSNPFN